MSPIRSRWLAACALLLSACQQADTSLETKSVELIGDDSVWITTDRVMLAALTKQLGTLQVATNSGAAIAGDDEVAVRVSASSLSLLSEVAHDEVHRCGGFMLHDTESEAVQALAIKDGASNAAQARIAYSIDNEATVAALLPTLEEPSVRKVIEEMSAFKTRFHTSATGTDASNWLRDLWQGYARARSDIKVELIDHQKTPQPSVSLTLPGALFPDEIVVLGGHLDSTVGRDATATAPGADDNASGIAALSEILRNAIKLNYRPDRTVVFYGYAAEEIGLVGSAEIAALAKSEGKDIVGVMQLDMTNVTAASAPYIALISDNTDAALNAFSAELIEKYVGIPWKFHACGYGCSDHASWTKNGFAATFPHEATKEEGSQLIHTVNDTLAAGKGNANHTMHFVKFGVAFMAEMAKGRIVPLAPPSECGPTLACAMGKVCQNGKCVIEPVKAPVCSDAAPCPVGFGCESGTCVAQSPQPDPGAGSDPGLDDGSASADDAGAPEPTPVASDAGATPSGDGVVRGGTAGCSAGSSAPGSPLLWLWSFAVVLARRLRGHRRSS